MATNDLPLTGLEITVPAPGEMFENRIIDPRNVAIEQARNTARKLPKDKRKEYQKRLKLVTQELKAAGYFEMLPVIESKREQFEVLIKEFLTARDEQNIPELRVAHREILQIKRDIATLRQRRDSLKPQIREYNALTSRLREHEVAIAREIEYRKAQVALAKESQNFQDIVIETYNRLGYKHERSVNGKLKVDEVRFQETHVTDTEVWFKILASEKKPVGYSSALPYGVKVSDLISKETEFELTIACQRQVQTYWSNTNGAWIKINRLGTTDGLLDKVTWNQVMDNYDHMNHHRIPLPIGVGAGQYIDWAYPNTQPHFLIAGGTGAGKSNQIRNFICTLISKHHPNEVGLVLVDMKEGTEFKIFENVPHLITPIVTTAKELAKVLIGLEVLRQDRSEELKTVFATDINQFNQRVPQNRQMRRIFVIVDEWATIRMNDPRASSTDNRTVEMTCRNYVSQLLAKSRAAGIHIILCTQAPYVKDVPGHDKANIGLIVCGHIDNESASRAILGTTEAAKIPDVQGRMLVKTGGRTWPVQTPFVSPDTVQSALGAAQIWDEIRPFELPEVDIPGGLTEQEIVKLALDEYQGKLSRVKMWKESMKDRGDISARAFYRMIDEIGEKETVEYEGTIYRVVKQKQGGYVLEGVNQDI